jgi:hypothetical protein
VASTVSFFWSTSSHGDSSGCDSGFLIESVLDVLGVHFGDLSGSLGFDSIFSFDNSCGFFDVCLEDLSALIRGFFFLKKGLWPSLVSLSVV